MSFFSSGFWIPSSIEFGTAFLATGLNLFDSYAATLICTLFSGIQLCMCRRIIQLHLRLCETNGLRAPFKQQRLQGRALVIFSVTFAALFIASTVVYCVQFSRNILALRSLARTSTSTVSSQNGNLSGVIWSCVDGQLGCVAVPLVDLKRGRTMEFAYASLVQALILATDVLLVLRCLFIFKDKPYIYYTAALSLSASVGVSIFGLTSLSKSGGLSGLSWNWTAVTANPSLPAGYHPAMSIVSSLIVNTVVSISIVSRMLFAKKRLQAHRISAVSSAALSTTSNVHLRNDVYSSAAALLAESALPPVLFGTIASICASPSMQKGAFKFDLVPKVAWVAFTALAPQLILVRILQGRAWSSTGLHTSKSSIGGGSGLIGSRTSSHAVGAPMISLSTRDGDGKGRALSSSDSLSTKI